MQPPPHAVDHDDVAPEASSMIESMRAHGYTLPAAVADLIDNSISAGATRVWLEFRWNGRDSRATIKDDGTGMDGDTLRSAMRLGSRSPLEEREPRDLGRFGLGLKTASLSQCRCLTVASTTGGSVHVRRWDLDHLARKDVHGWQLLRFPRAGSSHLLELPPGTRSGTTVLWEDLDRIAGDSDPADSRLRDHFLRLLEEIEVHLSMVFHRFLEGSSPALVIHLNGNRIRPWDPFLESHHATQRTPEEPVPVPGHPEPVRVKGFVLPHRDRLTDTLFQDAGGPAGWGVQQGFYLYRNRRLIVAGSWLGLGEPRAWTKEEHYKLARIRLDVPSSMDHLFQLDVKKSTASPPAIIRTRLMAIAGRVRHDARHVFTHRGRYGPRPRPQEMARPWKHVQVAGMTVHRIDRQHPLIGAFLDSLDPRGLKEMDTILRILEETVPVEQIWLDMADRSGGTARPFQTITDRQVRDILQTSYEILRERKGLSHDEALLRLSTCEEFMDEKTAAILATIRKVDPSCRS